MYVRDGHFFVILNNVLPIWTHIVLNYIGPDNGQGIIIYQDGEESVKEINKSGGTNPPGSSRVVVGRRYSDEDTDYTTVLVDELLFFNWKLTIQDIQQIANMQ